MQTNTKGEILSPVGSFEMLEAAVKSGADAVYLGAKDFSARRNAQNFTKEEIKKAVEYCHIRGVKTYLTLNILLKDEELEKAFLLARDAYNMGIDGIIVQDLGFAKILKDYLPELPLHASTQMSVHSKSALPLLKQLGFTQVVVSREMSKNDLEEFCKEAEKYNITVEVFVHGALCMCVSGQCLLSAFLGSRSGNRGLCAGPCRLPFKVKGGTGYDLSLKDLSLLEYITELYGMGVRSFKIEGRMKRPEYVAAATYACKQALYEGSVEKNLNETLQNVFSRSGFTSGYYQNKLGKEMFGIRTKEDVISADKAFPLLHELYRKERKSVAVTIKAEVLKNKPISLTISDGENAVTVTGNIPQPAKTKAVTKEDITENITKLGSTPYYHTDCEVVLDGGLFAAKGELNELRRTACEMLDSKRAKVNRTQSNTEFKLNKTKSGKTAVPQIYIRVENKDQIPSSLKGISALIVPLEKDFEPFLGVKNIVEIPRGIVSESLIENRLKIYKQKGFDTALCGNIAAVTIAKQNGFEVLADTGLNVLNSFSLKTLSELNVKSAVLSAEILLEDVKELDNELPKGIISYGNIPLMLFKNCPVKNGITCKECKQNGSITDRKGTVFPVRCRMGYSELLNSVPICLSDKQDLLSWLDFQILYFTKETKEQTEKIIADYIYKNPPENKYTRGLYFRGVM